MSFALLAQPGGRASLTDRVDANTPPKMVASAIWILGDRPSSETLQLLRSQVATMAEADNIDQVALAFVLASVADYQRAFEAAEEYLSIGNLSARAVFLCELTASSCDVRRDYPCDLNGAAMPGAVRWAKRQLEALSAQSPSEVASSLKLEAFARRFSDAQGRPLYGAVETELFMERCRAIVVGVLHPDCADAYEEL